MENEFFPTQKEEEARSLREKFSQLSKIKKRGFWAGILIVLMLVVWAIRAKTSGEIADLLLSPTTSSVVAGTDFNVALNLNTHGNNIVVVKGVVTYNPAEFSLQNWDTSSSVFSTGNSCVYNSKPCEIVTNDAANGKITIALGKPTPGVNTASGLIANLTFRALKAITPTAQNIKLSYVAYADYTDSDVILDDGVGTDILSTVSNSTITATLPTPTNLVASGFSATENSLTWDNTIGTVGITGYKIYRNNVAVGNVTTNSYKDTGLTPLTAYAYKVTAIDAASKESPQTATVSATTLADTTAPTVPSNVTTTSITMNQIKLSWTASTDNVAVTGYNVYRNGTKVGTSTSTNYTDNNLTPETSYKYEISAYDGAGNTSAKSAETSFVTKPDTEAPTTPSNLSATAVSISQINLAWNVSTDNVAVTGYNVYRNGIKVGTSATNSYQDKNLTVSSTYSYEISAYDAKNNESSKTSAVTATTNSDTQAPTAPAGVVANPVSLSQIDLSWAASTDNVGVTGYAIYRDGVKVATAAAVSYQDTGLTKFTTYAYVIYALDAAGNQSAPSTQISAKTLADTQAPSVPAGLQGTATSMTEIGLTWNASTDNVAVTGYNVYRNGAKIGTTAETKFSDSGLVAETTYAYTLTALDADNNESAKSSQISVATQSKKYTISNFVNLIADWLKVSSTSQADVNKDGIINSRDFGIMMSKWN